MIDFFKYEKRYKYPHMKPNDIEIWERFIKKYPNAYDRVQYDFHVGDPPPFNPLGDGGEDFNQDALYRLKIDVIGYKGDKIDIIEIKPDAGPSSIGQIISYVTLYARDENPTKALRPVIITNSLKPNMSFLARSEGVHVIVV